MDEVTEIIKIQNEDYLEIPTIMRQDKNDKFKEQIEKVIQIKNNFNSEEKKTIMIFNVKSFIDNICSDKEVGISEVITRHQV